MLKLVQQKLVVGILGVSVLAVSPAAFASGERYECKTGTSAEALAARY